jgi:hypothetical protein
MGVGAAAEAVLVRLRSSLPNLHSKLKLLRYLMTEACPDAIIAMLITDVL